MVGVDTILSEETMDFLSEMMNIGAGNAATALEQMLGTRTEVIIPRIHVLEYMDVECIFDNPSLPVTAIDAELVGDVRGFISFFIPDKDVVKLTNLMLKATPGGSTASATLDHSVISEIGNILMGVYLTAIHDFCRLNIYHKVPIMNRGILKIMLDKSLKHLSYEVKALIVVVNEFYAGVERIETSLVLIPNTASLSNLTDSIHQAMQ